VTPRLVNAVKARLTYPRTGFVAYPRKPSSRRLAQGVAGFILGSALAAIFTLHAREQLAPAISGFLFALVWTALAYRMDILRFYALSVLSLVAGLGFALLGLSQELGLALFYGLMGFALLISGGLTLHTYLKVNPEPEFDPA
jgi:hypothetical protein